jgi:hypothetical protein
MQKVIVEKERHGSWRKFHDHRHLKKFESKDIEEAPTQESMKIRHTVGYDSECKQLSDHLNPLKGYLRKACGRPYDKVYSEICSHIKLDSTQQRHIRGHVDGYVCLKAFERDRKIWVEETGGRGFLKACKGYRDRYFDQSLGYWIVRDMQVCPIEDSNFDFYVHPRTGILHEIKHKKKWSKQSPPPKLETLRKLDDRTELHLIDGIWYRIEFEPFPKLFTTIKYTGAFTGLLSDREVPTPHAFCRDRLTGQKLCEMWEMAPYVRRSLQNPGYSRPGRYAAVKRQLNAKELKKYALKNS